MSDSQSKQKAKKQERHYDNVEIKNAVTGTVIKGHDAVKAYFEQEQKLVEEHGASLIFQIYRINLNANTIEEFHGQKVGEVKADGKFVSGSDTVAVVKEKLIDLLKKASNGEDAQSKLIIYDNDRITLSFGRRMMRDNTLFYAENFVMLPAWVQVLVHRCEFEEFLQHLSMVTSNK